MLEFGFDVSVSSYQKAKRLMNLTESFKNILCFMFDDVDGLFSRSPLTIDITCTCIDLHVSFAIV